MSRITVDITYVEPVFDTIESQLTKAGLPKCFGRMVLPSLKQRMPVQFEDCFSPVATTPPKELHSISAESLLPDAPVLTHGMGVQVSAYENIAAHKKDIIHKYVRQCTACASCKSFDRCNALTQNSLRAIQLIEELEK